MTDRVGQFLVQFESAIARDSEVRTSQQQITAAWRSAGQLAELLEELRRQGIATASVRPEDLRTLREELDSMKSAEVGALIEKAEALLTLVADGMIDGDEGRLRSALDRARTVPGTPGRARSYPSNRQMHDRARQWESLPIGTRFARRGDPTTVGEIVANHDFLVDGTLYRYSGKGSPLSAAGVAISGSSENGWRTWIQLDNDDQ